MHLIVHRAFLERLLITLSNKLFGYPRPSYPILYHHANETVHNYTAK